MNKRIAKKIKKSLRHSSKQRLKACRILKINTDPFATGTFTALINSMMGYNYVSE